VPEVKNGLNKKVEKLARAILTLANIFREYSWVNTNLRKILQKTLAK
jgi:hypothetical protein